MAPKRQSYTVQQKLLILSEYQEGASVKGLPALSKKYGIPPDTLRGWVREKEQLLKAVENRDVESKKARRLEGGGRKTPFQSLEEKLYEWVRGKNVKGLKVKDNYIKQKALNLHAQMLLSQQEDLSQDDNLPKEFTASKGWVARFKNRKHLVSRRRTSNRVLPDDADEQARTFIQNVHALMVKHGIKYKNVINLDQVPRYFEVDNGATIAPKGNKHVILRKGGTQHKRFTATFAMTAGGEFQTPHVLFSKLVNKPRVPEGVLCDVNPTGMWNLDILFRYIKAVVLYRKETAWSREPILLLLDSYGPHVTLLESNKLKAYNCFTMLVPERLTCVLQPLDVGINRGFQSSYASKYDAYISKALEDSTLQTVNGNPKVPNYYDVSQWVLEWKATMDESTIKKSFVLCGLLKDDFSVESLHKPLQDLLSGDYFVDEWALQHKELLELEDDNENRSYIAPRWYLPEVTETNLFECVLVKLYRDTLAGRMPSSIEIDNYRESLIGYMQEDALELEDITNEDYYADLRSGKSFPGEIEMYSICNKEKVELIVFDDIHKSDFTYTCYGSTIKMEIVRIDNYFAVLMAE